MRDPIALRFLVSSLELYAAIIACLAATAGLLSHDHLIVEVGLKAVVASIFAELLKSKRSGHDAVVVSMVVSVVVVLFYLVGLPDAIVSSSSYVLITVLAIAMARAISGEVLYLLLSKSVPLFYVTTAYALLSQPLGESHIGFALPTACSAMFVLLSALALMGIPSVDSAATLRAITAKYPGGVISALSAVRLAILKSVMKALASLLSIKRTALPVIQGSVMKALGVMLPAWRDAAASFDRAMLAMGTRVLSSVRDLGDTSKKLEASVGGLVHKVSRAVELLQESLEGSLLLLLFAMSVFVLIAVIAYVLLFTS